VPDPDYGSDINWTLGTPNNGLVTSADSGTNAWGSDLDGDQNFTLASSYLYSPVIDLTGLKSATLTFSNACDFSRLDPTFGIPFEDGLLYVCTNGSTSPADLLMVTDYVGTATAGWEPSDPVDLTPFVGQNIRVVFYYEGVPMGDTMYGWTIDDIGITGVTAGGNVSITKNLGEGIWSLSSVSPIGLVPVQSGMAPSVTFSNLAAGQYVVQFGDVLYYQTPPDQTNTLTIGGTVNFIGNYTFLDANHNGISDAWEQEYFGAVTTNRTRLTYTSANGMSDYANFIAGLNPTNPASRFDFSSATVQSNGLVQLRWTVVTNRLYQVNASPDLNSWSPVTGWLQATSGATMDYTTTNSAAGPKFYRLQVQP
jgi:hypothetical protein